MTGLTGVANERPAQALLEGQGQQRYDRRRLGRSMGGGRAALRGRSQVERAMDGRVWYYCFLRTTTACRCVVSQEAAPANETDTEHALDTCQQAACYLQWSSNVSRHSKYKLVDASASRVARLQLSVC